MNEADIIGFTGVAILLLAFLLNLLKVLDYNNRVYISLNLAGAALACYASYMISYTPFIILEGCWFLVSMIVLVQSFKK